MNGVKDRETYEHPNDYMSSMAIFSQPWWLDAVAPKSWDEVILEKGGQIVARLPYVIKQAYGLTSLVMPRLTQNLGPWLRPSTGKYTTRLSEEKQLMTELIEKLPKFDLFVQNFPHSIKNWLPFYWKGFQQTTKYTYILQDMTNLDAVWQGLRSNIKTDIKKAQKQLATRCDLGLDTFLDLNEKTFSRQGLSLPYDRELVARLEQVCSIRKCRRMFFAEDVRGQIHAAVYIVWDEKAAYYLMGGSDPMLRNSGATSLLIWEAIQFASTVTQSFDFEGSMNEPIERFFRAFGATQTPYFQVSKINSLPLKIYRDVRSWLNLGLR